MSDAPTSPANSRLALLALGLLVGFVIGFIMLLSRLPVDSTLTDFNVSEVSSARMQGKDFEFYTELVQQVDYEGTITAEAPEQPVVRPATRVVPGNALNLSRNNLASESYAEIPASSLGQESYYLQAGNFAQPEDAERRRAAVLMLGLEAFIVKRQEINGSYGHRVRIGPFFDHARITEASKRLNRNKIQFEIVRVTG